MKTLWVTPESHQRIKLAAARQQLSMVELIEQWSQSL